MSRSSFKSTPASGSSFNFTLGYGLEDRSSRFRLPAGAGNFSLYHYVKNYSGPTQPPIQCVPGALSLGMKRIGREADHLPPSSAEVKECVDLYLHSPNTPSWRGAQLKKAQGQLCLPILKETEGVIIWRFTDWLCVGWLWFDSRQGKGFFISLPCPYRHRAPPNLLHNGHRVPFPVGKAAEVWIWLFTSI
jgi:hypothetical protein